MLKWVTVCVRRVQLAQRRSIECMQGADPLLLKLVDAGLIIRASRENPAVPPRNPKR